MLSRDIADGGVLLQPQAPQIGEAGNGFEVGDPGAWWGPHPRMELRPRKS